MIHFYTNILILLPLALVATAIPHSNVTNTILPRWKKQGQSANLYMDWWDIDNCSGTPNGGQLIIYGSDVTVQMASYYLSRNLANEEQLDFSIQTPGSQSLINDNDVLAPTSCEQWVSTANPEGKKKGCHNLPLTVSCLRLWDTQK